MEATSVIVNQAGAASIVISTRMNVGPSLAEIMQPALIR